MSGFLVTPEPFMWFDLDHRVRYAGLTADGRGFVAMDGAPAHDLDDDEVFYAEDVPTDPNDPRWERILGPKCKKAIGNEAFFIVPLVGDVVWQLYAAGYDTMGVFTGPDGKVVIVEATRARVLPTPRSMEALFIIEEWQDRRVAALV